MCFSATASFGAAGLLTVLGALSIKKAHPSAMRLFAATPLIFALQQACEGIIWLTWGKPDWDFLLMNATYIFLFFATIWWPFWAPATLLVVEKDAWRRKLLGIVSLFGDIFCITAAYYLIVHIVHADLSAGHVTYSTYSISASQWPTLVYVAIVALPSFISSLKKVWLLGLGIIGTFIATQLWYAHHFASVWCFFAAILSCIVLYIVSVNQDR